MGKQLVALTPPLVRFIEEQKLFFVSTAMNEGKINLSPKGLDTFKVLDETHVVWLNLTGSGNETAVHLKNDGRMTVMFCAFEGKPLILRLYGKAVAHAKGSAYWDKYISKFANIAGGRQLIAMKITMVQTSCGMGVPKFEYTRQRKELVTWAEKQGDEGLERYWKERNATGLDGHGSDF